MDEHGTVDTYTSDVLVIGGGGAALIAACRAAELGASVRVVSKKRPGIASCTAYAGGGFTVAVEGMSPREHRAMTLETGCGLNDRRLVQTLTAGGESALEYLENWGVSFRRRRGGASVRAGVSNPLLGGTGLTFPLLERCRELGVILHHPVRVRRLLQEDFGGPVLGAEGERRGQIQRFNAGATVLATGGGGWVYRKTDNPAGITGDGYSLALRAGARLRDMEFVQFYPLGSAAKGASWYVGAAILDHARLTDGSGEEFLPGLMKEWGLSSGREINQLARDRLSRAIELRRRRTNRVLLHLEDVPPSLRENADLHHTVSLVSGRRDDPWQPVEVAPIQHFMSGGVAIDNLGCTDVPRLLACGEVTGGVHGANRVGGNALTELAVFGLRAGEAAARAAQEMPSRAAEANTRPVGPVVTHQPTDGRGGCPVPFSAPGLRRHADQLLGPVRDESTLRRAHRLLGGWDPGDAAGEEAFMLATARLIAAAALAREESRGCHYREDFPEEADGLFIVYLDPQPVGDSGTVSARPEITGVDEGTG